MNRYIVLIIFFGGVMFFTSCRPFVGYSCHPAGYVFQPQMQALVDSFVYLHPSTYVELHVNKVCGVRVWLAVLYAGESPLSSIPACVYAQTSDGTCVAVYSGLEDVCVMKDTFQEVDEALVQQGRFLFIRRDWNGLHTREADANLRSPFIVTPGFISTQDLNTRAMMDSVRRHDKLSGKGSLY